VKIFVSSLALAPELIRRERPSHVVSLLSPEEIHLAAFDHAPERHLRLAMHDVGHDMSPPTGVPGETPPCAAHVENLIDFFTGWRSEQPILFHCWAGISRSTAAAFTLACARNPDADEREIAWALRQASPTAFPNPIIIAHADAALGRQGRMSDAVRAIGRPGDFDRATPFHLPAAFPAGKR
jgi:predicted protein tyrosine phosphatase